MGRFERIIAVALLVLAGCSAAISAPAGESRVEEHGASLRDALAIQVVHREARSAEGAIVSGSRREALDEALDDEVADGIEQERRFLAALNA